MTELYPYQRAGVQFLRVAESALLADEMGTGKTVQTIATLEEEDLYPAIIICPNSVKTNWVREFQKWAPSRRVEMAQGGTPQAQAAAEEVFAGASDVLVINWEAIKNLSKLAAFGSIRLESCSACDPTSKRRPALCQRENKILNTIRWKAVVADEVHKAKDPKAAQTRALWAIGDKAERRLALTGTPIEQSPAELWAVMRFVSPEEYPSKWTWIDRYANKVENPFSGGFDVVSLREDRREEFDKFFLPRFLRRTKAQVLPDLPPKIYEVREVTLSGKQRKAYDQVRDQMLAQIQGGILVADNSLTASLRLRQLASAYGEVVKADNWTGVTPDDPATGDLVDSQVRLSEPSSKLDVLEEVLDELGERQSVIFADSRQLLMLASDRLEDKEISHSIIAGGQSPEDRQASLDAFATGETRVALVVTSAGGEGVNGLQVADVAIFLQRPWSSIMNKQAEDRLHRIGQEGQSVTYIDLVSTDTIDEEMFQVLQRKEKRFQNIVRDEEVVSVEA